MLRISISSRMGSSSSSKYSTMFAEPTGFVLAFAGFSGLSGFGASSPGFSSFLGDWHSHAQCPSLPQLWHLPLQHLLLPSEPVAVRASSPADCDFLPDLFWFDLACRFFSRSASSQIRPIRVSVLRREPKMCAEVSALEAYLAKSSRMPLRTVF